MSLMRIVNLPMIRVRFEKNIENWIIYLRKLVALTFEEVEYKYLVTVENFGAMWEILDGRREKVYVDGVKSNRFETGFVPKWIFSLRGAAAASGNCVTSAARRDGLEKWREDRARDRSDSRERARYGQRFGVERVSCELPHISRRSTISSKGEGVREKRQSKKCQAEINDRAGADWFEKWRFWKSY